MSLWIVTSNYSSVATILCFCALLVWTIQLNQMEFFFLSFAYSLQITQPEPLVRLLAHRLYSLIAFLLKGQIYSRQKLIILEFNKLMCRLIILYTVILNNFLQSCYSMYSMLVHYRVYNHICNYWTFSPKATVSIWWELLSTEVIPARCGHSNSLYSEIPAQLSLPVGAIAKCQVEDDWLKRASWWEDK